MRESVGGNFVLVSSFIVLGACGDGSSGIGSCDDNSDCAPGVVCEGGSCVSQSSSRDNTNNTSGNSNTDNTNNTNTNTNTNTNNTNDNETPVEPPAPPPELTILSPLPGELVPDFTLIRVELNTSALPDVESVRATVGRSGSSTDRISLALAPTSAAAATTEFTALLNTRELPLMLFPYITVRATTSDGFETELGHSFAIDWAAPEVWFDSGDVQAYDPVENHCSQPFPVTGADNVRHGMVSRPGGTADTRDLVGPTTFPIRVRVEDRSNAFLLGDSTAVSTFAGIDEGAVNVFMLDNAALTEGATLFTEQGSRCGIDPAIRPGALEREPDEAIVLQLVAIPAGGDDWFQDPTMTPDEGPAPVLLDGLACSVAPVGLNTAAPDPLCDYTANGVIRWVKHGSSSCSDDGVFALAPIEAVADSVFCGGGYFDARNALSDGPACLTVEAADNHGATNVAYPIAICIDSDGVGGECSSFNPNAIVAACMGACVPDEVPPEYGAVVTSLD